jgi:hypothetical protein
MLHLPFSASVNYNCYFFIPIYMIISFNIFDTMDELAKYIGIF